MYPKQDFYSVVMENQKWLLHYVTSIVKNMQAAENIVQDVFIRAYKNYDNYEETGKIKQWLCTIARNASFRYLRESNRQNDVLLSSPIDLFDDVLQFGDILPDTAPLIEEQVLENELGIQIITAINQLPEQQKQVVYLRYMMDFSVNDVAVLTHQPTGSVKSKCYYGLEKVRRYLAHYLVEGEYIMDCKESYALLYHYAGNHILAQNRGRLEKHISVCKECKNNTESLKVLLQHIKPAEEGETRHYIIAIPLENGQTLFYGGANMFFDNYEEMNKILQEKDGYVPEDWNFSGRHDRGVEHLAELDNNGNPITFELAPCPDHDKRVRVRYKRLKQVYPEFINTSVMLIKSRIFTPLLEDSNLMIGKLQNHYGNNVKSGIYMAVPGNGKNVRVKKGNGVIDAGAYKFAFSDRYVTEDETIKLECSYLKK